MHKISLKNIHDYLALKNFSLQIFDENLDKVTLVDNNESFEVIIPRKEELTDYDLRINDFIQTLSSIENKEFKEVAENIINIGYDLLKFRFKANTTSEGNIPLEDYPKILEGIEKVMTYGACSVILPKSQYTKPYEEAKELVRNCEIAQTEKGSFVITVRVPLDNRYLKKQTEDEQEEYLKNLGRKTIGQIILGISEAKSVNIDDEDIFRKNYDEKLSKNVCDGVSEIMVKEEGFDVDISAKLNTFTPLEENIVTFTEIKSRGDFKKFNLMSSYLKKIPEEKTMTVNGLIIRLNDNPQNRLDERKLITLNDPKLKRNIYVHLTEEDYRRACLAHGEGKRVQVTGLLNKKLSKWCLDNPQEFKME